MMMLGRRIARAGLISTLDKRKLTPDGASAGLFVFDSKRTNDRSAGRGGHQVIVCLFEKLEAGRLLRNVDFMVQEVQRANKAYERNDADPARLLEDPTLLIKT
ncbi:hypothetical protein HPB47_014905, partial [Ixodes persulcatus]